MAIYSVLVPKTKSEGYGIRIVSEKLIYDISRNYSSVKELCDRCNALDVDTMHFDVVLEDFLSRKEDF
ncbi:MAG: hypothetical protein K6F88_09450 [Ruminococcus sp.]|nr:hypothetical protein [Ruminococcus sp.]